MALEKFTPSHDYTKAGFEGYIDRDHRGSPIIWPEGTDPAAVQRWRESGATPKDRDSKLKPKGGKAYTRTTTFVDAIDDKTTLSDWMQRKVLQGVVKDRAILEAVEAVEDQESSAGKGSLNKLAERARNAADADMKALMGTMIHEVLETHDAGEPVGLLLEEVAETLEGYKKHTAHLQMVAIEQFGVEDTYQIAGTLDRLVWDDRAGKLRVADVKSGSIYGVGKIARQMAVYAHMVKYDPMTFARTPNTHEGHEVDQEVALILHTPSDSPGVCNVYEVDIAAGWCSVDLCHKVRQERNKWNTKAFAPRLVAGTGYNV